MTAAKTIIVTGASRGIGAVITNYLLTTTTTPPPNLLLIARSSPPFEVFKSQYPSRVEILAADLADLSVAQRAVALALERFGGRLDGMVINHGILGSVTRLEDVDFEQWKKGVDVNFLSAVAFVKASIPHLRATKGRIIFTSSGAATSAVTGWGLYGSTKAALNHLNTTLACEEPEITSIAIRPGMVDTQMQDELRANHMDVLGPEHGARFANAHKEGKLLRPELPGHVIAKLVLDAPHELSGKFLTWNVPELAAFQE
ncbi:hypothetical protein AJ80_02938 [Polytolypa hystricis UAMH7299]|uniref:Short-chain dehydrogenase n=1 Tax=Polytolypa hystricis (strain UAMH7299) TaxID=1447883 RepID=A0A2B7YPW2_POLH7|nr:hypothetical protein AJ80_02938 [Polytolypa hystricis UAMH7299]